MAAESERRQHERIGSLEDAVAKIMVQHEQFKTALAENTAMTVTIAKNTAEIIALFKGIKGFRTFVLWVAPLIGIVLAAWAWIKAH